MRITLAFLALLFLCCSPENNRELLVENFEEIEISEVADPGSPSSAPEHRTKETILAYLDHLIGNDQVVAGQHCGDGPDQINAYYQEYVGRLAGQTNRYVGLIGADLGYFPSVKYPVNTLIDHWNEGGLVALSWHADNPFIDGYDSYWNTVDGKEKIQLRSLLKNADESQVKSNYRNELDRVAKALQELKSAGVAVIWRPFHEMNGDFFWWGINAYNNEQTNVGDFKALWKDLYNTLTYDYGLDNLIWTYSVIPFHGWNAKVTAYYPGSDYVDLVGMDYYGITPDFPGHKELKSLGKTVVMSEAGPKDSGYGQWDELQLVNALKGKAAYFLQWHSWEGAEVAIKDNRKANYMMNSKKVITRDELRLVDFSLHQ